MTNPAAPSTRARRAVESFRSAAETIGPITPGCALFALTRGQFSMIDALLHVLDEVGPSRISVWTWVVAEYEVQCIERLQIDGRITAGTLIIDPAARTKNAALLARWQSSHGPGSVRIVQNHAKLATVESASGLRVLLRGSMNLNFNPRLEQFDLTEGGEDFDLVRSVEEDLPALPLDCSLADAYSAAKVASAFPSETLNLFTSSRKVWAK